MVIQTTQHLMQLSNVLTTPRTHPNRHHRRHRSLLSTLPTVHPSRPAPTSRNTMGPSILAHSHPFIHPTTIHLNAEPTSHNNRFPRETRLTPPIRATRDSQPGERRSAETTGRDMRDRIQRCGEFKGGGEATGLYSRGSSAGLDQGSE